MFSTRRDLPFLVSILFLAVALVSMFRSGAVNEEGLTPDADAPFMVVLGIAQDAGYPQAGCRKECCASAWAEVSRRRHTVTVAIVDPKTRQRWFLDCSPDFREQLRELNRIAAPDKFPGIDGIFPTHAHMGHYTGLLHLGREVMGTQGVPVYVMPRMRTFLETNGPWEQLVELKNIALRNLADGVTVKLNDRLSLTPMLVPHRDEYSETVGFRVTGPDRSILYLPDIDKWTRWKTKIEEVLQTVEVAYLDGTFFADGELPGRDMSKIPHPFIAESIERFSKLDASERAKVRFLHLNHTNPALDPESDAAKAIEKAGHHVAKQGERVGL
ncbi:MAG: MBL fold metallo-hydrolase [Roseibacillus sp.]